MMHLLCFFPFINKVYYLFLQTMCALVHGVFAKNHVDYGFDVINILIGFNSADLLMQVKLCIISWYILFYTYAYIYNAILLCPENLIFD